MKFLKDLYNEILGGLMEDIKDTVEDIKSELVQPFLEIVDEFKNLNGLSHDDENEDDFDEYDDNDYRSHLPSNRNPTKNVETTKMKRVARVTIKGVCQLNGPKPFTRIIECPHSETGYYSQLMGNKSKQAQ